MDKQDMNIQRVSNNIKITDNSFDILKTHFSHCFNKDGKFDFAKFQKELEAQNVELSFEKESYGLDWLGKSYARLLASDPSTTLLKADEIHNQKPENKNSQNLLIKGDNLEVLKHFANAYYEKVKMIYIDPPYNTGNDGFIYQDDRKYTVEQLQELLGIDKERAKRILDFTQSKSNSHSAWLTFMYPRLYIAKQLLRDDGVIFVSIDDNEMAQLRLLMDEVFGEENFVADFPRKTKTMTGDEQNGINYQHDFLLCYAKNINFVFLKGEIRNYKNYSNPDNDQNGEWISGDPTAKSGGESTFFEIINPYTKKIDLPPKGRYWAFSKSTLEKYVESGKITFKKEHKKNERGFIFKRYKNELKGANNPISSLSFSDNEYLNQVGTKDLRILFNNDFFNNPKPIIFIKYLLNSYIEKNSSDLILDFFAGSGTTGDAVMQLNAEDGGNRKYILVQIAEPIDFKKNKTAYDFVKDELKAEPTIFEICKERLIRAAKKIKAETIDKKIAEKEKELQNLQSELNLEDRDEKINTLKQEIENLKNQDLGFKIFETMPLWEDYDFEAETFDSSQTLFDTGKLTKDDIKALLITWKTYDGMPLTEDLENIDLNGYTAYYANGKLYLMHKGFTTNTLKTLLEKIDSDRHFEPKSIIAFGYHFESARLRELSENVKNYANKKHIDIEFIIRY
ncbi:MAG: DNA methyltransferase [Spirochaetota bacterium]